MKQCPFLCKSSCRATHHEFCHFLAEFHHPFGAKHVHLQGEFDGLVELDCGGAVENHAHLRGQQVRVVVRQAQPGLHDVPLHGD